MLTPYCATLVTSQIDGPTVTSATTFTSVLPLQAKYAFPVQFFQFIGQQIRLRAAGRVTTTSTASNITFEVTAGTSIAGATTVVFTSGALTQVVSLTTVTWIVDLMLTVRALDTNSAAGLTFMGIGRLDSTLVSGGSQLPATSPVVGTAIDNTNVNYFDFGILTSVASTVTMICHQFQLDSMM